MKEAYVSLVLPFLKPTSYIELKKIDSTLNLCARNHEIILLFDFNEKQDFGIEFGLSGPVCIVYTNPTSSLNSARVAALARSSGDFVIEWQGDPNGLTAQVITELLEPTNHGIELVELESTKQSLSSRFFYRITNSLRPTRVPLRKSLARAFSRRALGQLLSGATFEPQLNVLFAELPVRRGSLKLPIGFASKETFANRISEAMTLLSKGSRFGTVVPLVFATISACFGMVVAIYALSIYIFNGQSPEGWTTLMVVTGLSQATILALGGLTWSRIDSLSKGMSRPYDATSEVVVFPPAS